MFVKGESKARKKRLVIRAEYRASPIPGKKRDGKGFYGKQCADEKCGFPGLVASTFLKIVTS